jgi:predicted aspartyl protease
MKRLLSVYLVWASLAVSPIAGTAASGDSTVAYDMLDHLMVVGVNINGSQEEYNFVIDTGGVTFIDKKVAEGLQLKQQAVMAKIDSLGLSGFRIDKVFCFTTFDFDLFDALGTPIHGIIGSNLLERYKVTLDFDAHSVTFSSDTTALDSAGGGLLMPFRNHAVNNAPLVAFTIGDRSLEGMIDTGQPYSLVLPLETFEEFEGLCLSDYVKSNGLMEEWPMTTADHNYLARLESVGFGDIKLDSLMCLFGQLPQMLSMPLIGMDLLSQFRLIINYPGDEILMVPYDDVDPVRNRFTIGINPDISTEGDIVIKGVWERSPAAGAGLRAGDTIVSFDSREATPVALSELMRMLDDDDTESITLGIAEGDTVRAVTIDKAMLF